MAAFAHFFVEAFAAFVEAFAPFFVFGFFVRAAGFFGLGSSVSSFFRKRRICLRAQGWPLFSPDRTDHDRLIVLSLFAMSVRLGLFLASMLA